MEFDVIVVGGGIIGCTHAYYLAKKGLSTCVIEAAQLGCGTSANSFGWINATTKTSDHGYYQLNALGVKMHAEMANEFGLQATSFRPSGSLGLANRSDPATYDSLRDQFQLLTEFGYDCRWLSSNDLNKLEPNLAFPKGTEALFSQTDSIINPPHFCQLMAQNLRNLGGQVFENTTAQEILADDNGAITGLATSAGMITSKYLVIATGPTTPETLSQLTGYDGFSTRFPVQKVPGLLLTTPPLATPVLPRRLVYTSGKDELHFLPEFHGGLKIGSDDVDGLVIEDQSPTHLRHLGRSLLRRAREFMPEFAGESCVDDCILGIGVRAYPKDGKSLAGAMPSAQGLYVIATHSGVTLAPAIGSLMADLVCNGATPKLLKPFSLSRIPGL